MMNKEDFLRYWKAKPFLYVFVKVIGEKVITDHPIVIGHIVSCQYHMVKGVKIRYIQVQGTNGVHYFGKYCEAKGNTVCLKKCSDKQEARKKSFRTQKERLIRKNHFRFGKGIKDARMPNKS